MSGTHLALHTGAAVVGTLAALFAVVTGRAGWVDRCGHVVMLVVMALPLLELAGSGVALPLRLAAVLVAWGTGWVTATVHRRAGHGPAAAVDLLATGVLVLLVPGSHTDLGTSGHVHQTLGLAAGLPALLVAAAWFATALVRCRPGGGHPRPGSACAAGMAGSMVVMVVMALAAW